MLLSRWWGLTLHPDHWREALVGQVWPSVEQASGQLAAWFYLLESAPTLELRIRVELTRPGSARFVAEALPDLVASAAAEPYEPDCARFGGAAGFAVARDFLHATSRLFAKSFASPRATQARSPLAAHLMLAFVRALCATPAAAVVLLSEHCRALLGEHRMRLQDTFDRSCSDLVAKSFVRRLEAEPSTLVRDFATCSATLAQTFSEQEASLERPREEVALVALHLAMNALGAVPVDEALYAHAIGRGLAAAREARWS